MISQRPLISVVSPVYKAGNIVDELVSRIVATVTTITDSYEIILVEDGSPDNSWEIIEANCRKNPHVKGVKLSRNFGQHYAISAGLAESSGEYVVVMDCDLQENPIYIADLYKEIQKGFDIVYTIKEQRVHSAFKNITAKLFFMVFNYLSENHVAKPGVGTYSILSRKVVDEFCRIRDVHRHYLMVLQSLGFRSTYIHIKHESRFKGKSSYTFAKLVNHAIDGITSQSDKLLRLSISLGFMIFLLAFIWAMTLVVLYFRHGAQPGYTSLMVMVLLSTGLILMSIGIAGIYIGKIFEQAKGRPLYIIDKKVNF
jgi:polyisoprenyl-phosphate glycosyltransferase